MTYTTPIHLYAQILDLIDFNGDIEQFLQDEEYMNYVETGLHLFEVLEKDKQHQFKTILQSHDMDKLETFYKDNFSEEQFGEELKKVTEKSIQEIIRRALPTISSEKIRQLDVLLGNKISY